MSCPPDAGSALNIEGAFVGAALGAAFAGPKGAIAGGVIGSLSGQDRSDIVSNIANTIVSQAFVESATIASLTTTTTQSILIESTQSPTDNTPIGCQACLSLRSDALARQTALLKEAAKYGKFPEEVMNPDTSTKWNDNLSSNCTAVCKSVVVQNVNQKSYANINLDVKALQSVVTEMQSSIKSKVENAFKGSQSILGPLGPPTLVAEMLSGPSSTCISNDISNNIISRITDDFVTDLVSRVSVFQLVSVYGSSIWLSGVEQNLHVESITNIISEMGVFNGIYSDIGQDTTSDTTIADESKVFYDNLLMGLTSTAEIFGSSFGSLSLAGILLFFTYIIYQMGVNMFGPIFGSSGSSSSGGTSEKSSFDWEKIKKWLNIGMFILVILTIAGFACYYFIDDLPVEILYASIAGGAIFGIFALFSAYKVSKVTKSDIAGSLKM